MNKLKNLFWSCFALFSVTAGILLTQSCKTTSDLRELKDIPIMSKEDASYRKDKSDPRNYLNRTDIGNSFTMQKAFNWVPTKVNTDFKVILLDGRYRDVDYYHFLKFNKWFKDLLFDAGIMSGIEAKKMNLDCDNYAMLYKSLMGISAYKSGDTLDVAVAVIVVRQVNEFGGIPGTGGLHMVNLVFTNNGWFVFEPQTGEFILLEKYPNQEYFQYMIL